MTKQITPPYGLTPEQRAKLIKSGLMTPPPPDSPEARPFCVVDDGSDKLETADDAN
jgi:hypothetical protein